MLRLLDGEDWSACDVGKETYGATSANKEGTEEVGLGCACIAHILKCRKDKKASLEAEVFEQTENATLLIMT